MDKKRHPNACESLAWVVSLFKNHTDLSEFFRLLEKANFQNKDTRPQTMGIGYQ